MRELSVGIGVVACVALVAWTACEGDQTTTASGDVGGSGGFTASSSSNTSSGGGGGGAAAHGGVGHACSSGSDCRAGLVCDPKKKTCQPGHDTPTGSPCTISDECKSGDYCAPGSKGSVCTKGGSGVAQTSCNSDADCATGFRCDLVGFGGQCVAEGDGDVGSTCSSSADCFGGLACSAGKCGPIVPGAPFGLPTWPGVTAAQCNDNSSSVAAYFQVPRAGKAQDFYRLPFPNDVRVSSGALDMSGFPTPGSAFLGYDIVQRYVDAATSSFKGFGVYESVFFRFSGELESAALDGNVILVDLTSGGGASYYYEYSVGGGHYICPNWVAVRPSQGAPYTPGHTYAVYITTSVKAQGGAPIAVPPDLTALLAPAAPTDPALAPHWPKYQPLRDYLASAMVDVSTILNASVFTVGDPTATVTALATAIAASPPPVATAWTLCDGTNVSPCSDATGDRACPTTTDPDFYELHALVTLPIFQSGTAPYLTPTDGGGLVLDSMGVPQKQTTEDVCLALSVPKSTMPVGGYPMVVFAHGIGGSFRTHIVEGIAKDFAQGVDDGQGHIVKAAVLGIDQVQTGPRRNGSMQSSNDLFLNYANPAAVQGNVQQGAADQLSLEQFLPSVVLSGASSPTGQPISFAGPPVFFGHSQGSSEGGLMLPTSGYAAAVLAGQGACLMDSLVTKSQPVDIAATVPFVLEDADPVTHRLPGAHDPASASDTDQDHPVLNLIQMFMDPADPISFGVATVKKPPAGGAPHPLFQPYGVGDTTTPGLVQATYALNVGLGLVTADASVTTSDPIGMLTSIPTPASGNLTVSGKQVSALVREYAPSAGGDADLVVFDVTTARGDAERFLAGALFGGIPQVGL